jgi:predicted MFS family arabinose efflux permease
VAVRSRLLHAALAGDLDPRLGPVAAIAFLYGVSFSTFWVYLGVFAVDGMRWRPDAVGALFLVSAPAAAAANYASGHVSDRVGRKRPIVASFLAGAAVLLALAAVRGHAPAAFALVVAMGVAGAPADTLDRVLVADLVVDEAERERGYATTRLASNLGVLAGPPAAGLVIATAGWSALLVGIAAVGLVGAAVAARRLPAPTAARPAAGRAAGGAGRALAADRPFQLLLLSTLLGWVVYCAFEAVLPVIAVADYGVEPSTWGLLLVIGPLLVVGGQLRLTRAAAPVPPAPRLAAAMLLMGLPFLALLKWDSVAAIAAVMVVFVVGEMLWVPTSQALAADLAPPAIRGAYFGALAATTGPAWTLTPFIALRLRSSGGGASVWLLVAAVAVAGAGAGVAAVRTAARRRRPALAGR